MYIRQLEYPNLAVVYDPTGEFNLAGESATIRPFTDPLAPVLLNGELVYPQTLPIDLEACTMMDMLLGPEAPSSLEFTRD